MHLGGADPGVLVLDQFVVRNERGWTCPLSDVDEGERVSVRGVLCRDGETTPILGTLDTPAAPPATTSPGRSRTPIGLCC